MSQTGSVKAVDTTIRLIQAIQKLDQTGITQLSDKLGIPKSTVHSHLSTLEKHGYVTNDDGTYQIGLKFFAIGEQARRRHVNIEEVRDQVDELAEETGELAILWAEENGKGIAIYLSQGMKAKSRKAHPGLQAYLHCSGFGKAILSRLSEETLDEIIDETGLPKLTEQTTTDRERLKEELIKVEEQGYALDEREYHPNVRCVGAPIELSDGKLFAISVSGPTTRISDERFREQLPAKVQKAAEDIHAVATYQQPFSQPSNLID